MKERIRVFHLEDYKIIRDGIRFLLSQDDEIEVVGEASKGEELFEKLPSLEVDVLLSDIYLDGMDESRTMDGFAVCERMQREFPQIAIIAHSVYDDADRVARIMNAGAKGFVSKKGGYEELLLAIKTVATGKKFICKETSRKLKNLNQYLEGTANTLIGEKDLFSTREKEVLDLLGKGFSTRDISQRLFITEKTVETHRRNMAEKAKVKNTAELVAFAAARGFFKH